MLGNKVIPAISLVLLFPSLALATTPAPWCGPGTILEVAGASGAFVDDAPQYYGDGPDYWWVYDSGNTQFELNSTDIDAGGGTDGVVCYVADGTDDLSCNGNIELVADEDIIFNADVPANLTQLRTNSIGSTLALDMYGAPTTQWDTAGMLMFNAKRLTYGAAGNYWNVYNAGGTAWEFWATDIDAGGGTDGVVFSVDDGTDDVAFGGDISADNLDLSAGDPLNLKLTSAGRVYTSHARLIIGLATTDRFAFTNNNESSYWYTDSAGTFTDATGTGFTFASDVKFDSSVTHTPTIIDCDDDQYTVLATDSVIIADTDVGSCTGNLDVLLPAAAGLGRVIEITNIGATTAVAVTPDGTEEVNNGGAGTAYNVSANGAGVAVRDVNQTDYHWIVRP